MSASASVSVSASACAAMVRALAVLALCASGAAADTRIDDARKAIDEVRFDDAQRSLIAVLEAGGSSPATVREIYKLLGASAVALGKTDDAEKYYRAYLALDPKASLDAGTSPKLRAPFDAAKSYITANGPLDVVAEHVADGVRVRVISDPLALVRTARIGETSVALVDRGALVAAAIGPVLVLDRYGNVLVEVAVTGAPAADPALDPADAPPPPPPAMPTASPEQRPLGTGFYVLAVPTGLLLAAGVGFGAASFLYNSKVQVALKNSSAHYYTDVVDRQKKVTLFWKLSAIIGGAGLVLAIPTAILYKRSRDTMVVPYVDGDGAGATVVGRF